MSGAPPKVNLGQNNNSAINQMAQELIEFRKGTSQKTAEIQKLQNVYEEIQMQNMQLQ